MDEIVDLIATDASASDISDAIKNQIFAKAAEKLDAIRPFVADAMFGNNEDNLDDDEEEDYSEEE